MEKSNRKLINRILYPLFRLGARAEVHMFFGLPGCGKSSHAAYTVRQCVKRQIPVYSNVPIKGAKQLDIKILISTSMSLARCLLSMKLD